tara:strand:- start:6994 stop:7761 length:768 start_codon:yes stop_codon:yes gene_type:complete
MPEDLDGRIKAYYKLKQKYEDKIQRQKMRVLRDPSLTVREKRERVRLIKKQCVNCKKEGGTIFSTSDHTLRAVCGNRGAPCDLNIEISRGEFADVRNVRKTFEEELEKGKVDIIRTKLDLLFNYADEATSLERFNRLKEEISQYSKPIEILTESYLTVVNNVKNQQTIQDLDAQLFTLTEELGSLVERFRTAPQPGLVTDMVELYITRISPLVSRRRELQYAEVDVVRDSDDSLRLVEEPYTLGNLLINLDALGA